MYGVMPSIISNPALLMFVLLNHVAADIMNLKNIAMLAASYLTANNVIVFCCCVIPLMILFRWMIASNVSHLTASPSKRSFEILSDRSRTSHRPTCLRL